jgi:predicted ATPase
VLDNAEHLLPGVAHELSALRTIEGPVMTVTSRERLLLEGEQLYPVPPMQEQESLELFRLRALALDPGFAANGAVEELCERLDHLPLALELAAARVKALPTRQILERLDRSLPLLTGGRRDAPERQRTLRGAIAWSYELLSPDEQAAFRRLGVFAGGWTLDAAEEVAGAGLDTIQSLVDKSLVRFDGERYSLLETIREFTLELLQEACELDETRQRHFAFFYALAEAADTSAEGDYGRPQILRREQENMRAALDGAVAAGEITPAVELMAMLENFWVTTNPFEGARRFEELLPHELPERLRARALRCFAGSLWLSGEYERSHRTNEESLALFRSLGDEEGVGVLLHRIGISTMYLGDPEEARRLLDESLRILRKVGSVRGEAEVMGALAYLLDKERDHAAAIELFTRAAEMAADIGFTWWQVGMLGGLAECHVQLGRLDEAEAVAREGLRLAREIGDRQACVYGVVHFAWIARLRGYEWRAGLLWGAVEAEEARAPVGQWETERETYAERVTGGGGEELERGRRQGRGLSFEAAIEEALG